jgi:hypothetical protein
MPAPIIKSFAEKSGKSEKEVERLYKESKKIVSKEYNLKESDGESFYQLVIGVLKKMCGISDSITIHICSNCQEEVSDSSKFCGSCGGELMDGETGMMYKISKSDIDALSSFLYTMLKTKIVFSDLMRFIKNTVRAHSEPTQDSFVEFVKSLSEKDIRNLIK